MAKRGQRNLEKRIEIWTLHNLGFSNREIGRRLSISESCVRKTIKRKVETGSFCVRKRVGRPRSTTKKEDKYIVINSLRNRRRTAPDLADDFNEHHTTKISTMTVKRRLLEVGLRGRVAVKKPLLTTVHKQKRLV